MVSLARYPRTFWVLWTGTLVNRIGMLVLPFLSLYLTSVRGLSIPQATLISGLHGAGGFAAGLLGGTLADRWGRKPVLVTSLAGGALLLASMPLAGSALLLGVLVGLYGLVGEAYRPAVSAAVADVVAPERQREAFALLYWAINLGAAIGPALGGALAAWGYGWLFAIDAATVATYALVVGVGVRETRPADAPRRTGVLAGMGDAWADRRLRVATIALFLLIVGFVQVFVTLPLTMRADGFTPAQYGLAIGLNGALIVVLSLPVARWTTTRPTPAVVGGGMALVGAGLAVFAVAHTLALVALGITLLTIGEMTVLPVMLSVVARMAPDGRRGVYQGVYQSGWGLAATLGPVLGGVVLERTGAEALWLGAGALATGAGALVWHARLGADVAPGDD